MINNGFWKEAASSWSWSTKRDIQVKTGDVSLRFDGKLNKTEEVFEEDEYLDFDKIDYEATVKSMMSGGDAILKGNVECIKDTNNGICLDLDRFDHYLEQENLDGFINCFKMLQDCGLPAVLTEKIKEIVKRMDVLKDAIKKFKKVYEADITIFIENYIPETLNLSVGYIEYINAKVDEMILVSTQTEVIEALGTLLIGINDKIDEIYKFASIELKAAAKALNANMNLDGHVDTKYKIH